MRKASQALQEATEPQPWLGSCPRAPALAQELPERGRGAGDHQLGVCADRRGGQRLRRPPGRHPIHPLGSAPLGLSLPAG